MITTHAIIHIDSGMLVGLGDCEAAAWSDAEREARAAHIELDREDHECRQAEAGTAWRAASTGGLTVAEPYSLAAAALGRSRSPAKAAAARENGKRGGRPRKA